MVSGQPARGTELLSIQHENTSNNGMRNIFLYKGLVAVVPRYHKGYNRDKSLKTVYRFLPREVGSLLVWYLWLIRPFSILLQHQVTSTLRDQYYPRATSALLWPDVDGKQHATSRLLSQVIRQATLRWMGQEINISTLRHLIIAFGRKIDSKDSTLTELSKEEVDEMIDEVEAETREMQAGHSPQTAHAVYALDISRVFSNRLHLVEAHLKTSTRWHEALHFASSLEEGKTKQLDSCSTDLNVQLAERMSVNYLSLLRENFGPNARFRGEQEEVLQAIMTGVTVVAYVAGTGSGKSLMFLLPACFPGYRQTIVIAPLAALRTDIAARCKQLSIRATVWKQGSCDETASIILATPETIGTDAFVAFTQRLSASGQLERIVIDEFHYIILPDTQYRPHLLNLRAVTKYATRLTLLSATLPYKEQYKALRLAGLSTDTVVYRESTARGNLQYEVHHVHCAIETAAADLTAYIQSELRHFQTILVYVDTTSLADELASLLDCDKFHGQMTNEEKEAGYRAFSLLTQGAFIATSAFTAGVHCPSLRAVFRLGKPANLISWAQESGRGGRDGLACTARIVLSPGIRNMHFDKADKACQDLVTAFIQDGTQNSMCRRRVLDDYFDNDTARKMCKPVERKCDICQEQFYTSGTSHVRKVAAPRDTTPHPVPTNSMDPPTTPKRQTARSTHHLESSLFTPGLHTPSIVSSSPGYELSAQGDTPLKPASSFLGSNSSPAVTNTRFVLSPKRPGYRETAISYESPVCSAEKRPYSQSKNPLSS